MKSFETICKELNKENDEIFAKVCEILDERLDDDAVGQYGCDLHNYLFNEEQAFIWNNEAESAVDSVNVWSAIRLVQTYEKDNLPNDEHWQRRTLDGQVWDNYGTY